MRRPFSDVLFMLEMGTRRSPKTSRITLAFGGVVVAGARAVGADEVGRRRPAEGLDRAMAWRIAVMLPVASGVGA